MKSPWGIDQLTEETKLKNQAQIEAIKEECHLYASVFNTPQGVKILENLQKVLESPTWKPELKEAYGYYREGQNDIIRHILNRVNKAREL